MPDLQDDVVLELNGKSFAPSPLCSVRDLASLLAGWHSCAEDNVAAAVVLSPGSLSWSFFLGSARLSGMYTKTDEIMNGAPVWKGSQSADGKFVYLSTASGSYGAWVIAESGDRTTWESPPASWVRRSRQSGKWLQPANDGKQVNVSVAVSCSSGRTAPKTVLRCECLTITQNDANRSLVPYDDQRGCSAGTLVDKPQPLSFAGFQSSHD
jgi:hypothetical protein